MTGEGAVIYPVAVGLGGSANGAAMEGHGARPIIALIDVVAFSVHLSARPSPCGSSDIGTVLIVLNR